MKKLVTSIISIVLILGMSLTVYAADSKWTSTENVNLTKTQNRFNIEVSVNNSAPYAGGEFGIQCGDGVAIKSVTYNQEGSKVGPTSARGLTWFSFFSGNNDFRGEVKATVILEYTGTQNTSVVVDNISLYTKDGAKIETEKFAPRKVIAINREGASNPIDPPNPPQDGGNNDGENPSEVNNGSNNGEGNSSSESGLTSGSTSSDKNIASSGNNEDTESSEDQADNSSNDKKNNNESTKGKGEKSSEDNKDVQNEEKASISPVIITLLIISIGANGVLGYLIIKNKNKK